MTDLATKFEDYGLEAIIYTDIGRRRHDDRSQHRSDGRACASRENSGVASGGVASLADIEQLCAMEEEGVEGVILGRSLYEVRSISRRRRSGQTH